MPHPCHLLPCPVLLHPTWPTCPLLPPAPAPGPSSTLSPYLLPPLVPSKQTLQPCFPCDSPFAMLPPSAVFSSPPDLACVPRLQLPTRRHFLPAQHTCSGIPHPFSDPPRSSQCNVYLVFCTVKSAEVMGHGQSKAGKGADSDWLWGSVAVAAVPLPSPGPRVPTPGQLARAVHRAVSAAHVKNR